MTIVSYFLTYIPASARVIRILYHQKRDMDHFLQSNNSVSRMNYFRIFALASIDISLTLPIGIVNILLVVMAVLSRPGPFPIYSGWTYLHVDWKPVGVSYANIVAGGTSSVAEVYVDRWSSVVLAFATFGLFGVTAEARASYWRVICTLCGWFGWTPTLRALKARSQLGTMEFGERPQDASLNIDVEYVNPCLV